MTAVIIGCGSIGSRHAKNLAKFGVGLQLFDTNSKQQQALASETGGATPQSLEEALESYPDMAIVTTPSNHHLDPAMKAVEAGCHLFIEKPISNSEDGLEKLSDMVDGKNIVTMIGCNLRFHPAIKTIQELLQSDAVGEVISARIEGGSDLRNWHPDENHRDMYSAKAGIGGALLDYIHELNYARWFFGKPQSVTAMVGESSSLDIETEDTASLVTRFRNGILCEFHLDYIQRSYSRSCQIIGERGTIRWEWNSRSVRRYDPKVDAWIEEWTVEDDDWEENQMYIDELHHFLSCIEREEETICPIQDGWEDLRLALAAKESGKKKRHIDL